MKYVKSYFLKSIMLGISVLTLFNCSSDADDSPSPDPNQNSDPPKQITSFLNISDFDLPQQDAQGFTMLKAQDDSRIVYVDNNTGDDNTGKVYAVNDPEIGTAPFTPNNTIKPFATIAAAQNNMRDNEADILLLAAGGVWNESLKLTHGKSDEARSIYASYGEGKRPELRTGFGSGITNLQITNVIVSGIKFWAHTRDDEGPYLESFDPGGPGFNFYNGHGKPVLNVLIEDCFFRCYKGNVITGIVDEGRVPMEKIVLRRNIFSRNYNNKSHSQGLFYNGSGESNGTTILLEGNIFDHNGWRTQRTTAGMSADNGQATFFNHNTYFANAKGILFYGNIFLRAASIGTKWTANEGMNSSRDVALIDNLYVDGEIGISIGGNATGALRFQNIMISDNIFSNIGRSKPTNRTLSWGVDIKDWNGGEVKNNLFLHQKDEEITNLFAIRLNTETESSNVKVTNNIVYGLTGKPRTKLELFKVENGGKASNMTISGNYIYDSGNTAIVSYNGDAGYSFSKNYYLSTSNDATWFYGNESSISLENWRSNFESDAETFDLSIWSEPTRDVGGYLSTLGKGNSIDDLINVLYEQSRSNWNANLTAPYINRWIREGFGE